MRKEAEVTDWDVSMADRKTEEFTALQTFLNRSFGGILRDVEEDCEVPEDCSVEELFSQANPLRQQPFQAPSRQLQQLLETEEISEDQWPLDEELSEYIEEHPYYLHTMVFEEREDLIERLAASHPRNIRELLDAKDHHGNSALLLAVKLAASNLDMVEALLEAGADPNVKDASGWSVLDEAVVKGSATLTGLIFDKMHKVRLGKMEEEKTKAVRGLKLLPDFYMEIKWEFDSKMIPFVSKLAPHDTCRLWKSGANLRLDTTLVGWKNLRAKRRNISLLFHGQKSPYTLLVANHSRQLLVNPLEPVDAEERAAIITDIMKTDPIQGEIKLSNSEVRQCTGWTGHPVATRIAGWSCQKYEIQLNASVGYKKRGFQVLSVDEESYFRNCSGAAPKPRYSFVPPCEEEEEAEAREYGRVLQRRGKVNCWTTRSFPLTLQAFLPVLELLSSGHASLKPLHKFLASKSLSRYLPEDTFPVKVELPLNLSIKAVVTFTRCDLVSSDASVFVLPSYPLESRKIAQKTLTCPRKRMLLANLVV
jgi:hypothetical protein